MEMRILERARLAGASLAGFALGQALGQLTNLRLLDIGQLNMVEASVLSWLALVIAKRLKV